MSKHNSSTKTSMGLYSNRLQVPIKELSADWFPEEGELFQDSSDNLYMGDNVTASNALTPINGGGGGSGGGSAGLEYVFSPDTDPVTGANPAFFCLNNATVGSATKCYVSIVGNDSEPWSNFLKLVTSGTLSIYWMNGSASMVTAFAITRMVGQPNYFEFDVTHKGGQLPTGNCYLGFVPDAPGVRELIVGLVQTSTNDPVVTVIKNSYQQEARPSRIDVGKYKIPIPGAFTANKTVCDRLLYHDITNDILVLAQVNGTDEINITTFASGVPADDILGLDGPTPLRIRTTI